MDVCLVPLDARPSPHGSHGHKTPLVEELWGLKLMLGAFNSSSLLLSHILQRLCYLVHFAAVKTASEGVK